MAMSLPELAKQFASTVGVLDVDKKRVVYHALNTNLFAGMAYEDGILYVHARTIHTAMPHEQQLMAEAEMIAFVRSRL